MPEMYRCKRRFERGDYMQRSLSRRAASYRLPVLHTDAQKISHHAAPQHKLSVLKWSTGHPNTTLHQCIGRYVHPDVTNGSGGTSAALQVCTLCTPTEGGLDCTKPSVRPVCHLHQELLRTGSRHAQLCAESSTRPVAKRHWPCRQPLRHQCLRLESGLRTAPQLAYHKRQCCTLDLRVSARSSPKASSQMVRCLQHGIIVSWLSYHHRAMTGRSILYHQALDDECMRLLDRKYSVVIVSQACLCSFLDLCFGPSTGDKPAENPRNDVPPVSPDEREKNPGALHDALVPARIMAPHAKMNELQIVRQGIGLL